ncbi:MAG: Tim44/TimA family putative adaptor protein [Rickettsiales bacterium]|nr:Tim44/TimA family putative adaptor protein [Rickettsiales bacterium]
MPADIIVLAAIAIFVLLRLRAVLGHKIGHDQPPPVPRDQPDESDRVVQPMPRPLGPVIEGDAQQVVNTPEADTALNALSPELRECLSAMKKIDPSFTLTKFLGGSQIAFEMVLDAFATDDRDTLKMLLSKDVYESFRKELETASTDGTRTQTTLVALKSHLCEATLNKNTARLVVKFESEQIQLVRDAENHVIDGDASDIQNVDDEWTFERDLRSSSPDWKIVAT